MEDENLSDSGDEGVIYYECRLCGVQLPGYARDAHRLMHRNNGDVLPHRRHHNNQPNLGNAEQNVQGHVQGHENAIDDNSSRDTNDFVGDCGEISHSFECGICSKTFKEENEVEEHRRSHTREEANANQNDEQERNEQGQGQNLQDNAGINNSPDSDGDDQEIRMFRCILCNVVVQGDQRDEHREMHRNQRPILRGRRRIPRVVQA